MRILVTGGAGQVGTDLIRLLHSKGHELHVFDLARPPVDLPTDVSWRRGDVCVGPEVTEAIAAIRPEVIYHLAAILSASGEKIPHRAWCVNMDGTYHVLEAARHHGVRQVMWASTIAVFGPGLQSPVPNDVPLLPRTMYGITKVAGELLGAYYHDTWGLDFRAVRFPGLINAGIPGGGTTDYALFMYVDGVRYGKYECFVSEDSRVPMMYMPDALRALVQLSGADRQRLKRCTYNIGAMSPTAGEFAAAVRARVPGVELTFRSDPRRQAILDSWPAAVDDAAARAEWDWQHEYDLEKMSDDLVPKVRALFA